jgi:hypothetical protein
VFFALVFWSSLAGICLTNSLVLVNVGPTFVGSSEVDVANKRAVIVWRVGSPVLTLGYLRRKIKVEPKTSH